ncbi:MAG: alkaline phytoceramidase [Planctomycetota bacterium]
MISNLPLLLVALLGLRLLASTDARATHPAFIDARERSFFAVFFAGLALTALGSSWYHLAPTNDSLFWDRLPLTLVFMAFFTATIAERVSLRVGLALLPFALAAGLGSIVYWHLGERGGHGDLRAYAWVQFFPLVAIPLLVTLLPARYTRSSDLLWVVGWYALAKALEWQDAAIFRALGLVSGHTLKHLASAMACLQILRMLRRRLPAGTGQS